MKTVAHLVVFFAVVVFSACSSEPAGGEDVGQQDLQGPDEQQIGCLGTTCSTLADCAKSGPCVILAACNDGCCTYQYKPAGTSCGGGCLDGGSCNGAGQCVGGEMTLCPDSDGNPCTEAVCDLESGECVTEEVAVADGTRPMTSYCWDDIVCKFGKVDESAARPSALALQCEAQEAAIDPFGCVGAVRCVDAEPECVVELKAEGSQCWSGGGGKSDTCKGSSCSAEGKCLADAIFDVTCAEADYPLECGAECRPCTSLLCHWIPQPGTESAKVKVRYCKVEAQVGTICDDGSDCTAGDQCVLSGQAEGPLGKETLGLCQPGPGKSKDDCLAELELPSLPCLKAGMECTIEEGCALNQDKADSWCQPPGIICYSTEQTFCSYLNVGPNWDAQTGCNLVILDGDGCDDGNQCTADSCDYKTGCLHTPLDGNPCDDGIKQTVDDRCVKELCVGLPDPDGDGIANTGYAQPCKGGQTKACNDNCPDHYNPEQEDANGDGLGDLCTCQPNCGGKECGPDGCGGSCGGCPANHLCTIAAVCQCLPDCTGKQCGPNGCGGSCGQCLPNHLCTIDGACVCLPDCTGKQCGSNGCGGNCGSCPAGFACQAGICQCQPDCAGKVCGPDGCGGSCGQCLVAGTSCSGGQCVADCTPVNGGWSDWYWAPCSVTCGGGTMTGTRYCNAPAPSCGGAECLGSATTTQACNTQACCSPVNGGWSDWYWGACSKSCGGGTMIGSRYCNNPPPSCGGASCSGSDSTSQPCNTQACLPTVCGPMTMWQECKVAEYVSGIHGDSSSPEACALSCGEKQALCAKYIWYSDDPQTGAVCVCHSAAGIGESTYPFKQGNSFGWKIWAAECH